MSLTLAWNLVLAAAVNNCVAGLLLKQSRLSVPDAGLVSLILSPWLMAAMVFYGVNVILFAKALDRLEVSAAYPVLAGFGFGLMAIFSRWFFGERLEFSQLLGAGFILVGIVLVARTGNG
jgi:multidrug transporter EmrE-like cation transporter